MRILWVKVENAGEKKIFLRPSLAPGTGRATKQFCPHHEGAAPNLVRES